MDVLDAFLARHAAVAEEDVHWETTHGPILLHLAYYVTDAAPPEQLVTSVRAVVLSGADVLVLRNADAVHALPGGRREPGETFEETLGREIREESGFSIGRPRPLGVVHLRHLTSRPAGYPFPYPDFLWAVHVVEVANGPAEPAHDDYEEEAGFEPIERALGRVDLGSRIFIRAAGPT